MGFDVWLRRKMQDVGVSRTQLIARLSRPGEHDQRQNVYKWLNGGATPSYDKAQKIADALGVDQDEALRAAGHIPAQPGPARDSPVEQAMADVIAEDTLRRVLDLLAHMTPEDRARVRGVLSSWDSP